MSGLTAGESFLKSILESFRFVTASGSRTATVALTGTLTALPEFKCKAVILLSECSFATGNGSTLALDAPPILLPCNNTNDIQVTGGGSLNYLILL
jgi:hypothetical protein